MYGSRPDDHRYIDSSEEITLSELSPPETTTTTTRPPSSNTSTTTQPLTPAMSYSEGSDSGSSPSKQYSRPTHFVSQDSIIIEDDEDYEVMSDNEVEEEETDARMAARVMHNPPHHQLPDGKSPHHLSHADDDDDMSFEGDADDEGGDGETDEERVRRRMFQQPPQTPSTSRDLLDLGPSSSTEAMLSPLTPRRSHREQMNELSALFERDSKRKKEHGRSKSGGGGSDGASLTPLPTSLLKYIRKWSKEKSNDTVVDGQIKRSATASGDNDDDSLGREAGSDVLVANDADDDVDDELSFGDSTVDWDYPAANEIDWNDMPSIPLQFQCVIDEQKRQRTPHYLDSSLLSAEITVAEADRFAWEHGMLLQAVLQLLAERDQVGVEGSIHSGDNILKKGPLKKLSSRGSKSKLSTQWKVKYVELRHGNLCYYEDSEDGRKTIIHLRQSDAEVKQSPPSKSHPGFVLELSVLGASTSYWMANSEEERQAWIKSIQSAMLGSVAPRRDVDLAPHHDALVTYNAIRERIRAAGTSEQYIEAAHMVARGDEAVRVPVEWVLQQLEEQPHLIESQVSRNHAKSAASAHKQLKSLIVEFWKKLHLISFCVNGIMIPRSSTLATERLVGALTRAFLEFDKVVADDEERSPELTELQALAYARNVLLAVIHNRETDYCSLAVHHMFENPSVAVVPANEEANHIITLEVSVAGEELPDETMLFANEMSGWLWVRRLKQPPKSRKKRFVVMSGGVLSYYEAALPRPNGLRGQTVLTGATVESEVDTTAETEERYTVTIQSRKHDLVLSFEGETDFIDWKDCIKDEVSSAVISSFVDESAMLQEDDAFDASLLGGNGLGIDSAIQEGDYEGESTELTSELISKQQEFHAYRKSNILGSSASRLGRAAGKTAGKIADTAGKVAETAGKAAGKMAGTAGKAAGKVAGTAGKLTDEGIRIAKSTAAGSIRGSIRVAKGAISKTPGVNVVRGAVGRTVGRLRSASKGTSSELVEREGAGSLKRRPSMQMLLSNTALADKREPTVQCVVQSSQSFHVVASGGDEVLLIVHAKLYQAFLLRGGPSGRMAQGDALIEVDVVETLGDDADDDSESGAAICALPEALWRF